MAQQLYILDSKGDPGRDVFRASPWTADAAIFADEVAGVRCVSGSSQIAKVLRHAVAETAHGRLAAAVLVGDAYEEDHLDAEVMADAARLRTLGVRVFAFFEGGDDRARRKFGVVADMTGGALLPFDCNAPDRLRELLAGVAAYAAGGLPALEEAAAKRLPAARLLLEHLRG